MSDDDLLGELRTALTPDPVPAAVVEAARASFTWRSVDEELAELLSDSADLALTGVRGTGDRRLSFEAPQLVIEFVLVPGPRGSRLEGQLAPPGPARIEVRHGDRDDRDPGRRPRPVRARRRPQRAARPARAARRRPARPHAGDERLTPGRERGRGSAATPARTVVQLLAAVLAALTALTALAFGAAAVFARRVLLDEALGLVARGLVTVLDGRRLHQVRRRVVERARDAVVERQLDQPDGVDDDARRVGESQTSSFTSAVSGTSPNGVPSTRMYAHLRSCSHGTWSDGPMWTLPAPRS